MADLGDTLPFRADVYDKPAEEGGVLTNATSAVLTVTLPDGTTATPTVANPTAGKYTSDYVTTAASPQGRYVGSWLFTFSGGATAAYVETFDVGSGVVTVDEALAHLRAVGIITSEGDLDYLQWLTFVATDAIEADLRRAIMPRTVVETYDGHGSNVLILRSMPVLSVTSIVENGTAVTDYSVRNDAGLLYRGTAPAAAAWSAGWQNITVTYRAGYNNPPSYVRKVALNMIQAAWQGSQQAPHPALSEFNEADVFEAQSTLSELERRAYDSLRVVSFA